MIDLLQNFSATQIIVFLCCFALAVKGAWDLFDFFKTKYQEKFNKDYFMKEKEKTLEEHYQKCFDQHKESVKKYNNLEIKIDNLTDNINNKFKDLDKRFDQLNDNDKHTIKSTIVKDYHYFVEQQGWIDDFSLDTIMLLYDDYSKLGGNSYIKNLVEELKKLPKAPPK